MKVVNLFPLSIIQEKISLDKNIKNELTNGKKIKVDNIGKFILV